MNTTREKDMDAATRRAAFLEASDHVVFEGFEDAYADGCEHRDRQFAEWLAAWANCHDERSAEGVLLSRLINAHKRGEHVS